ncbi:YvrJ protein family protein [Hathewaya proteolytica DSM 3090]|uniref:YvrJ protein family protein n=1 Tax=Hathewaya proteolytica DSM 3090 TaxID=1121331 RepID=A0A1M6R497_9CLOT|nr:YvrJ family protein [Hathewaya proteolytica]SHK27167.1 YvrJ protein family protein [Hathewaya proteolytica DSM 3090]
MQSIGNIGFPMAITVYVLVRIEKKFDILSKNLYDLTSAINKSMGR